MLVDQVPVRADCPVVDSSPLADLIVQIEVAQVHAGSPGARRTIHVALLEVVVAPRARGPGKVSDYQIRLIRWKISTLPPGNF
jgi:hypothetical protein